MTDRESPATQPDATPPPPRSPWPWVFLALWFLWLGAMIFMSWPELRRERPEHAEERMPQVKSQSDK